MARRKGRAGNGEGTEPKQNASGRWYVAVTMGYDAATGKAVRKFAYAKTRAEVQAKKLQLLAQATGGAIRESPKELTVSRLCEEYLLHKKANWRPKTYTSAEAAVRLHIAPYLGAVRLTALDARTVSKWLRSRPQTRVTQIARAHLSAACDLAVRWEWMSRNPVPITEGIKAPPRAVPGELTIEGIKATLEASKGHRYHVVAVLMLGCGLRISEALGLCWEDFDAGKSTLHIRRQLTKISGGNSGPYALGPTKTKSSTASLVIPRSVAAALEEVRERQAVEKAAVVARGESWGNEWGLIVTTASGSPAWRTNVSISLKKCLARAGVPPVNPHHRRHAFASYLIGEGLPITDVAAAMRHSGPSITMSTYAHKLAGRESLAASLLDAVMGDGVESQK